MWRAYRAEEHLSFSVLTCEDAEPLEIAACILSMVWKALIWFHQTELRAVDTMFCTLCSDRLYKGNVAYSKIAKVFCFVLVLNYD